MKPPGKLSGIAATVTLAAAVLVSVPLTATTALAAPAPDPAAGGTPTPAAHPVTRSCNVVTKAGYMACFAVRRTDIKTHKGLFTATAHGRAPRSAAAAAAAAAAGQTPNGYGPAQLQNAYNLPSATAGSGQTVAIVDAFDDPNAEADLQLYRAQYGLPACTAATSCFRKVAQDGSTNYPQPDPTGGWEAEESLDLDMVSAVCPNCRILLVEATDNSNTNLGLAVNEAVKLGAKYVSNSYGSSEDPNETTIEDASYYNHPGVAITASSGDSGYFVEYPAASRYVTAVGGTTLNADATTARGWGETAWPGAGSGCSSYESKPAWQTDTGCANRTVADVSAVADPDTGVAVYDTYGQPGWTVFGGTSVSSPIIASTFALAGSPVTGTYPSSYPYAHTSALNDVTSGNNNGGYPCTPAYLCNAGPGYDGPTGLGTPDGVSAFTFGPHGTVSGAVTDATAHKPIAEVEVDIGTNRALTDASGGYTLPVPPGTYTVAVKAFAYATQTVSAVRVSDGQSLKENFALQALPTVTVSGTVTDGSGAGWPLYAKISVAGTPVATYSNPTTGKYSLTLPANATYKLTVDPGYLGYQQVQASIQAGTGNLTRDLSVPVDPTACSASGYHVDYTGDTQTFDGTTVPAGWSVVSAPGSDGAWQFGAPRTNNTGGSGNFAIAVVGDNPINTTLLSPVYDMSQDTAPYLQFDTEYFGSTENIDLSTDGGQTWTTVWTPYWVGIPEGPEVQTVPLPTAAGQSQVQLRFQMNFNAYGLGSYDFHWSLDNVFVGNRTCDPSAGGLVEGTVTDANTGAGINGATVTSVSDSTITATTAPTTGDPAIGDGFYAFFVPGAGGEQFTAAMGDYTTTAGSATVTANAVTPLNFVLPTGRLSVTPGQATATAVMGHTVTRSLTFTNTGTAPLTVTLHPQSGQFIQLGQPANAPNQPAVRIKGSYSPEPLVAVKRTGKPAAAFPTASLPDAGAQPADAPWTSIANLPVAELDNSAATDPASGLVYSVGGIIDDKGLAVAVPTGYVHNPDTRAWTQLPSMRFAREKPQVAFIDDKLYVAGGWDNNGVPVSQVEVYDPATSQWSVRASMPLGVAAGAVTALDGKMYVIGGCDYYACDRTEVQIYDPSTDTWTTAAAYPQPIAFDACGGIDGKIYCAGGIDAISGTDTANGYTYNPVTNSWSPIAPYPTDIWGMGYGAANGQLLLSDGIIQQIGSVGEITNQGYAYHPSNDTWTALPNSNQAVYRGGSACGFYLMGGAPSVFPSLTDAAQQLPGYACGTISVPWLSESQTQFTINPGAKTTVTVTLNAGDASVTQPGIYSAALDISTDTPYLTPSVGVTLNAMPPDSWGKITGTVSGTECNGTTVPLSGAMVEIDGTTASYTLRTDPSGGYGLWIDQGQNPLTLIAALDNWQTQLATVKIKGGKTTTANFTLIPLQC